MQKKINKGLLKMAERLTRIGVERNEKIPIFCTGILHQPKRPKK